MFESALPDDTRQRLEGYGPAGIVVGIPSYRNSRTVAQVVTEVGRALGEHYAHLSPLIVHADGHSFDDTLTIAASTPIPDGVERIPTRYQGLPGKGSALRAIFEIASTLQARALLLIEADVTSLEAGWIPRLLEPVLAGELDLVLPRYAAVEPSLDANDLILYPALSAIFRLPIRYPAGGEAAMVGGVAAYFAERDVWETDVSRDGVDVWMTLEVGLGEGRVGEVYLPEKRHRSQESPTLAEAKFLQEVGTVFRFASLRESAWRESFYPHPIVRLGRPIEPATPATEPDAPTELLRAEAREAVGPTIQRLWATSFTEEHLSRVATLVAHGNGEFDERLWARLIYDAIVVYNLGEGDPDKAVTSLLPLFALRRAALLDEIARSAAPPHEARNAAIERQRLAFEQEIDYLHERWESYVSPETLDLWRELGIGPDEGFPDL